MCGFRAAVFVVFAMAIAGIAIGAPAGAAADPIVVEARPIALDVGDPERRRVGRLEYRGGLQLSSPDKRFGGFSGLLVAADGSSFRAISDQGWLLTGRLLEDREGRLAGVAECELSALRAADGKPLGGGPKREADAESLARDGGDGFLVGFERHHRILRYRHPGARPTPVAAPRGLDAAPENEGLEALTRLADGRLLALTEGLPAPGGVVGWVGGPGNWQRLTWLTSEGYVPTDATALPGSDVLVLERRFPPPGARVREVPPAAVTAGAALDGDVLARLEGSLTFDNMEGLSARAAADDTLVYLISDDNYSVLQRTLLMMFRLID